MKSKLNISSDYAMNRLELFGLYLSPYSLRQVIRTIGEYLKSNKYHYQISINVNKVVQAQQNSRLMTVINNADISNADGMPIKWYARLKKGISLPRMGGLDYMNICARVYPDRRYYFLGATDEVLSEVVQYYSERHNMNIVGYRNGYFTKEQDLRIVQEVNDSGADILFLALGTPRKEYFLYDNRKRLDTSFAVGVGGAFDIIAGKTRRAPIWCQNMGLEWLWRVLLEPRRLWKRYAESNSRFIYYLLIDLMGMWGRRSR